MRAFVTSFAIGVVGIGALAAVPLRVSAHHSSAVFDQSRTLTLEGVVEEFRWNNPHASIEVWVQVNGQEPEQWSIEMSGPDRLARAGWRPGLLEAGDAVSLVIHPRRDDTKGGQYVSGTGPRGPLIDESQSASVPAETLSPALATSACLPRVELTVVDARPSSETRPVVQGEDTIFVQRDAITTTRDISEISIAGDDFDTRIHIKYTPDAAARLRDATTGHDGLDLAFVVVDDVWLAFTWQGPYGMGPDGTQLSIRNGLVKAEKLMESIRGCPGTQAR
jgi:hypothetical protein